VKNNLKDFLPAELKKLNEMAGQPFRAAQLSGWMYKKYADSFSAMKNLPSPLIKTLSSKYEINNLEPAEKQCSKDGTVKYLFRLSDGNFIESVMIPSGERRTVCISSQVGCKFACKFCASGRMGFARNLRPGEMTDQAIHFLRSGGKITNYVFMGMGEPLDNFDNTIKAVMIMNDPAALDIGARRITISTCGFVPGIKKLCGVDLQINLSVSLHAANDKLRDELVPINRRYPIKELIKECKHYLSGRNRLLTFEYILINGVNMSAEDARALAGLANSVRAKVNVIPYSSTDSEDFRAPSKDEIKHFTGLLERAGVNVTERLSKGSDISAACGQLAGRRTR